MANANVAIITTNKTFDEWRVATNDLITDRNTLRNSDYVKDDGDLYLQDGKIVISRSTGGTTLTNDNDALIGGILTTTDLTVVDDAIIGGNASMISAQARLTVNNSINTRNLTSNSFITAANVIATGYVTVNGTQRDLNNNVLNVNSFLLVAHTGNVQITGNLNTGDLVNTNRLQVSSNATINGSLVVGSNNTINGNLVVGSSGFIGQNLNVSGTATATLLRSNSLTVSGFSTLSGANIATANITTANVVSLNVNTASSIAEIANLVVANSTTTNAVVRTLTVLNNIGQLNVAILNSTSQLNAVSANIQTLQVTSLSVQDPISAPSESDSSSYRLRVAQSTAGDGFFGVYQGSPQRGNALIQFNSTAGSWRITSNSTQGIYSTILTTANIVTGVSSTSDINVASASAVKTAFDAATLAFAQANSAANLVSVLANGTLRMANANINFNNTATVNVSVTAGGSRVANVEFTVNTSIFTNQSVTTAAYNQANTANNTANGAYFRANTANSTASLAYDQANLAYAQANTANNTANGAYFRANTANSTASLSYDQANLAYTQANTANNTANGAYFRANTANTTASNAYLTANNAANTVRVSANNGSTLTSRQLNFVNTATVTVSVTANPDGNANVAFTSTATGSGTPGGSNKQVQFNNSGTFGGATDLIYDSASKRVGISTASPLSKLHITNTLSGAQSLKSLFRIHDMWNEGNNGQFFQILGGTEGINLLSNYGNLVLGAREAGDDVHSSNVVIQRTSGNVGIGLSSPRSRLEIASDAGSIGFNYGPISSPVRGNMYYITDDNGWQFRIGKVNVNTGTFTPQVSIVDNGTISVNHQITTKNVTVQQMFVQGIGGDPGMPSFGVLTVDGVSVRDTSILTSGTVAPARLGSGTASATTYLAGDSTYKPINNFLRHVSTGYVGGNVFVSINPPTGSAVGDIWIEI